MLSPLVSFLGFILSQSFVCIDRLDCVKRDYFMCGAQFCFAKSVLAGPNHWLVLSCVAAFMSDLNICFQVGL